MIDLAFNAWLRASRRAPSPDGVLNNIDPRVLSYKGSSQLLSSLGAGVLHVCIFVTACRPRARTVMHQRKCVTAVGFEPTQIALVELESTPLDHSGKLSFLEARGRACHVLMHCAPFAKTYLCLNIVRVHKLFHLVARASSGMVIALGSRFGWPRTYHSILRCLRVLFSRLCCVQCALNL